MGLGERCKLPQRAPQRKPNFVHLALKSDIWWHQIYYFFLRINRPQCVKGTAKFFFGGLATIWGPVPPGPSVEPPLIINPTVGCHYFQPNPQLPSQLLMIISQMLTLIIPILGNICNRVANFRHKFVSCSRLLDRQSKKQDTKLLAITSLLSDFLHFFSNRLGSKFATNLSLNIPSRFKHVATLPCEI